MSVERHPWPLSQDARRGLGPRWRVTVQIVAAAAVVFVGLAAFSAWRVAGQAHWSAGTLAWAPVLLILGTASYVLRFARWHVLITQLAPRLPLSSSARIYAAGFALGLTPGRLGEFLKFSFLRSEVGLPEMLTAPVFPMERATEAASFLFLAVVGASAGQLPLGRLSAAAIAAAALLPVAALVGLGVRALVRRGALPASIQAPAGVSQLVRGALATVSLRPLALALAAALVARCFDGLLFWVAMSVSGLDIPLAGAAVAFGLAGLAGGLSLLPAGVMAVEGSLVASVAALGGQLELGLAAALLARSVTLWIWVPIGLWFATSSTWTGPAAGAAGPPEPRAKGEAPNSRPEPLRRAG